MGYQRGNREWNMFLPCLVIEDDRHLEKSVFDFQWMNIYFDVMVL